MTNYEVILARIQADAAYLSRLDWGEPRDGHPEGSLRRHIAELESNLVRLQNKLSNAEVCKLRILIHTHDTFKPDAKSGVAIADPNSHASLARQFLEQFVDDEELLNIVQHHDEPFALWRKQRYGGDPSERLNKLLKMICDWDLFLAFLIVDGCTVGKSTESLEWFFAQIDGKIESRVKADWMALVVGGES